MIKAEQQPEVIHRPTWARNACLVGASLGVIVAVVALYVMCSVPNGATVTLFLMGLGFVGLFGYGFLYIPKEIFVTPDGVGLVFANRTVMAPWSEVIIRKYYDRARGGEPVAGTWMIAVDFIGHATRNVAFPVKNETAATGLHGRLQSLKSEFECAKDFRNGDTIPQHRSHDAGRLT